MEKKTIYIISGTAVVIIIIIIVVVVVFVVPRNQTNSVQPVTPVTPMIIGSPMLIKNTDYVIMQNTVLKDYIYYGLGAKTESELNNTLIIQSIINSIIQIIKDNDIKYNLQRNKPIFLIGSSAQNFDEFQSLKGLKTSDGLRIQLDIPAFGTNRTVPGFISNIFNNCYNSTYLDEDIIFHEFMHEIESRGMTQTQKDILNNIYRKYNVFSNYYDIKSYAFVNVHEFFAEMAQVYCQMTSRLDVTGGVTIKILQDYLPELYTFLETIFDIYPNDVLNTMCTNCNKKLLCCRDENENCPLWANTGECNKNPVFMNTRCRKSCQICK
jgi:hypothetical protein